MKLIVLLSVLAVGLCETADHIKCNLEPKAASGKVSPGEDWIDIKGECVNLARQQIRMEFQAALAYLQLGAYFNQYDINRPGFAKFFFSAASEERSHAIKLFDYLLMRGQMTQFHKDPQLHTLLVHNITDSALHSLNTDLLNPERPVNGVDALNRALAFEVKVTRSIKRMIRACEDDTKMSDVEKELYNTEGGADRIAANDYHMVDWLITDLLDEQLTGQRELAGRISTLNKMNDGYGKIAEFLYDKKLLEELNSKAA